MAMELHDNLANLTELNEETIISQLKGRYDSKRIYTYVGDILIAMNPYERLPLYTPQVQQRYMDADADKDSLPPHVYKVADQAYENMVRGGEPQCFVISGESGAGKTETTKIIVNHVMELCKSGKKDLEDRIKTVNPLLEAFGNAKTVMNNNSSRFGKYLELRFDETGSVLGATMSHYLLEKSRVAVRNQNENNFHIFYQLYAGFSSEGVLDKYGLTVPSAHHYLQGVGAPSDSEILGERYLTEYNEVVDGLKSVGFPGEKIESMLKAMAAILLIGDIKFAEDGSGVRITSSPDVHRKASELLRIDAEDFAKSLVCSTAIARGEIITRNFNLESAPDNRDAVAKGIYGRIFAWIFEVCNSILVDKGTNSGKTLTMGVLDIFGFENFKINSLEQMCINITNEQLQQYFNHHIFVMEQAEYAKEGVDFSKIDFVDNQPTLDLFLKKPAGILAILDEESRFPKATDLTFVEKCVASLNNHPSKAFTPARSSRDLNYTITHYAGQVNYTMDNFLEKNRDTLSSDVSNVMQNSLDTLISGVFPPEPEEAGGGGGATSKKKLNSLALGFKTSLADLMTRMNKCQAHFVRCLKPNAVQKPSTWDPELVTRQLRYAGVLETIRIRKLGYSFRMEFPQFVRRYKLLSYKYHESPPETRETCQKILSDIKLDNYQLGHNKIFMKYYHSDVLSTEAAKHTGALLFLQKVVKGYVARERYAPLVQQYRGMASRISDFLGGIEDQGARVAEASHALKRTDDEENEKRPWLERVKAQAAWAEADRQEKEEARKAALAKAAAEPKKFKTKPVNGYFVWERNEHLTLKVGPLERPWRKKIDEVTGRHYFKNIETKTTTWVDPRSHEARPHDALATEGDDLPYGWDEAETTSGTVFYIDHLTNTHHREHPRIELQKKQQQYKRKQSVADVEAAAKTEAIKELKAKRRRLITKKAQATTAEESEQLEKRIQALDTAILKESSSLESVRTANNALLSTINNLRAKKTRNEQTAAASVSVAANIWLKKGLGKNRMLGKK